MKQMRFFKKMVCSGLIALTCGMTTMTAQVTIGALTDPQSFSVLELISNDKMGLRLPQLTTEQRKSITTNEFKSNELANGLVIYNTTTNCVEYWNSKRWVSLCKGQAEITFIDGSNHPADPTQPAFLPNGETRGTYTPIDEPNCTTLNPAFGFSVVLGSDFFSINVLDAATGKFSVTMTANPTVAQRTAVLRVTNNCTQEYKDFVFTQEYCSATTPINAPAIKVNGSVVQNNGNLNFCAGGTLLLAVNSPQQDVEYKWYAVSTPDVLLGTGASITSSVAAVQSYSTIKCVAKSITNACVQPQSAQFNFNVTAAPAKPTITSNTGGNYICGGNITLTASSAGADSYQWYNGTVQVSNNATNTISFSSGTGTITAYAVKNGCISEVSDPFEIRGSSGSISSVSIKDGNNTVGTTIDVTGSSTGNISSKTFTADISGATGATAGAIYEWVVTGNATTTSSLTGSSITVQFGEYNLNGTNNTAIVTLKVKNPCTATQVTQQVNVNITNPCPAVVISLYVPSPTTNVSLTAGSANGSRTLYVQMQNGYNSDYEFYWYKRPNTTTPLNNGGLPAGNYPATTTGTYFCVIKSKCNPLMSVTSNDFIVVP